MHLAHCVVHKSVQRLRSLRFYSQFLRGLWGIQAIPLSVPWLLDQLQDERDSQNWAPRKKPKRRPLASPTSVPTGVGPLTFARKTAAGMEKLAGHPFGSRAGSTDQYHGAGPRQRATLSKQIGVVGVSRDLLAQLTSDSTGRCKAT